MGATRIETTSDDSGITFWDIGLCHSVWLAVTLALLRHLLWMFSRNNDDVYRSTCGRWIYRRRDLTIFAVGLYLFMITLALNLLGNRILEAYAHGCHRPLKCRNRRLRDVGEKSGSDCPCRQCCGGSNWYWFGKLLHPQFLYGWFYLVQRIRY